MEGIKIIKQDDRQYTVNGVIVFQDINNNWITTQELPKNVVMQFHKKLSLESKKKVMRKQSFFNRIKALRK